MQRPSNRRGKQKTPRGTDRTPDPTSVEPTFSFRRRLSYRSLSEFKAECTRQEAEDSVPSLLSWKHPRPDVSIIPSLLRDPDHRRKQPVVDTASVLFWIKNCLMQWRLLNFQIGEALKKRKEKAKEELSCATLAIVKQQGKVTELESRVDGIRLSIASSHIRHQLDPAVRSIEGLQGELCKKMEILKASMMTALETVQLVDGAVLGDCVHQPDLTSFVRALSMADQLLQEFSKTLSDFDHPTKSKRGSVSRSPSPRRGRSPSPRRGSHPSRGSTRSPSPKQFSLPKVFENVERVSVVSRELRDTIQEESKLMQEIAELLQEKHKKQLRVNVMRIQRSYVEHSDGMD